MDAGEEKIADGAELARVRAQARRVYLQTAVAAALLTALALAIPWPR